MEDDDADRRRLFAWSSISSAFARQLKYRREDLGLSQAEIARRMTEVAGLPMHQQTVAKIERQQRAVNIEEAFAFASVLEAPLMDMLAGGYRLSPAQASNMLTDTEAAVSRLESRLRAEEEALEAAEQVEAQARRQVDSARARITRLTAHLTQQRARLEMLRRDFGGATNG